MIHREVTQKIVDAAKAVHGVLGGDHSQEVYARALAVEFDLQGVHFEKSKSYPVVYCDVIVGDVEVDFLVDEKVLVRVLAEPTVEPHLYSSLRHTLGIANMPIGMLLAFGSQRPDLRRVSSKKEERGSKVSRKSSKVDH